MMPRSRLALALATSLSLAACGGKNGTLSLTILTPSTDDPFAQASQVRITVGDGMMDLVTKTTGVSGGHFDLTFDQKPQKDGSFPILVEALDGSGSTIAWGRTPAVQLAAADQGPYTVWVARPGRPYPAADDLHGLRVGAGAANIAGLGVMVAGGLDTSGGVLASAKVFDVYTYRTIDVTDMTHPRAYPTGVGAVGIHAIVCFGATQSAVAGPVSDCELYDPTSGTGLGLWAALPAPAGAPVEARSAATVSPFGSNAVLMSGGLDTNGARLASAAILTTDAAPVLSATSVGMTTARAFHCTAPVTFPDGTGALVFGGAAPGGPSAERIIGQSFTPYAGFEAIPSLDYATCTALPDGRVLVLGGASSSGAQQTAFVVTPTLPAATVTPLPDALSVARAHHSATVAGNQVVVCGGIDATGDANGTCDILAADSLARIATVQLTTPRRDHAAALLESGVVFLGGGLTTGNQPTASIELYTPPE